MTAHKLQHESKPEGLTGGDPTNIPLRKLGYEVPDDPCSCGNTCNFTN